VEYILRVAAAANPGETAQGGNRRWQSLGKKSDGTNYIYLSNQDDNRINLCKGAVLMTLVLGRGGSRDRRCWLVIKWN
jgi:hypothetical protein